MAAVRNKMLRFMDQNPTWLLLYSYQKLLIEKVSERSKRAQNIGLNFCSLTALANSYSASLLFQQLCFWLWNLLLQYKLEILASEYCSPGIGIWVKLKVKQLLSELMPKDIFRVVWLLPIWESLHHCRKQFAFKFTMHCIMMPSNGMWNKFLKNLFFSVHMRARMQEGKIQYIWVIIWVRMFLLLAGSRETGWCSFPKYLALPHVWEGREGKGWRKDTFQALQKLAKSTGHSKPSDYNVLRG